MNLPSLSLAITCVLLFASGLLPAGTLGPITYINDGTSVAISRFSDDIEGPVVIPETIEGKPVTTIGAYAFMGCWNLTEVTLPSGITRIEEFAFLRCEQIASLAIPAGVRWIGNGAFMGLDQLTSVTIPSGITLIGNYTFEDCTNLENVMIPQGVTRIGTYAFGGCTSLASVKIPASVTRIDDHAFTDCMDFEEVTFLGDAPSMGKGVFDYGTTVYSSPNKKGFTFPKWQGYDSEFIPTPVIAVVSEDKRVLKNGKGKQQFGSAKVGKKGGEKVYAIANVGNLGLTGLTFILSGANKGDFKILTSRRITKLQGGEYVGLLVRFIPKGKGLRKATLQIRSNDPKNPSFLVNLSGQGK
ncbi:leucine-rich repeat protein [Luteolibacter yonseiensis]|uniref:Leucine-rich repeat protein n=1 Tax=Luteolibacter yonseiensis TaxID=1144680 RepID=A0A934R840_9BACT|nr:leucine-rich repeat protein [Luteolibacter yonseiensis]MBK1816970.1 leucine-rich repeat protein [Luteolibacter yonseiensis]